jgi:hypothetical protein
LTDPIESETSDDSEATESQGAPQQQPRPTANRGSGRAPTPAVLVVAALASIGAGAIHATAVGSHNEHRQAMYAFATLAALQIGWGALAFVRPSRWVSLLGAAIGATALGGWVVARTSGIGFVDGLEAVEDVQFADALAAALATVAVLGALAVLVGRFAWVRRPQPVLMGVAMMATVGLVVPGMVSAGGHAHAGGHEEAGHEEAGHEGGEGHDDMDHGSTAIPPEPYDGSLPVDFSGVDGVSADEQREAEELATQTIERLPQFADTETAYERGYRSIGDAATGVEHYMNWRAIDDEYTLDPDHPESLVYQVDGEERTLVAAMFMLSSEDTLDTTPDIGGDLIQWHVHDDLCFAGEQFAWRVADVAAPPEECRPGTQRLGEPGTSPMIHVWITGHPCGPFAALEGVGGGQIPEGETRACDHQHADPDADVGEGPPGGPGGGETARGS